MEQSNKFEHRNTFLGNRKIHVRYFCELRRQWAYPDSPLQVTAHALYILLHYWGVKVTSAKVFFGLIWLRLPTCLFSVTSIHETIQTLTQCWEVNFKILRWGLHCSTKHFYQFANVSSLLYAQDLSPHTHVDRKKARSWFFFFFFFFFFGGGGGYYWC